MLPDLTIAASSPATGTGVRIVRAFLPGAQAVEV